MQPDLASQVQGLLQVRTLLGEELYQQKLGELRTAYGASAIDALLGTEHRTTARQHEQTISGGHVDIAVSGDVHGHVFLDGQRGKDAETLLRAYLERLIRRCNTLPLQGVREQRAIDDVLAIDLEQVYTQLATTLHVERERIENEPDKQAFHASKYLAEHVGVHLLPSMLRTAIWCFDANEARAHSADPLGLPVRAGTGAELDRISKEDLERNVRRWARTSFHGPQLVTEAIAQHQRLMVLGEPGSGKTTALRYLALTLARAGVDHVIDLQARLQGWSQKGQASRLLPIFVPLLPLAKRLETDKATQGASAVLWNFLVSHLEPGGANRGLAAAVHDELEAGRVLLLLDGLDEVAGPTSRHATVQAVQAFALDYPRCRMVVACRIRAYEGKHNHAWQLPGWPTATLADWTFGQMDAFISAWYQAAAEVNGMPSERRDSRRAALRRAVRERDDLQQLGIRPLLLTIMALVHLNDGQLPEERVGLYSRCVDILLGQWETAGRDASDYGSLMEYIELPSGDVTGLRLLLSQAAYLAHTSKKDTLEINDLRFLVQDALERLGHDNPARGAKLFLEYTDHRAGLLQATEAGDAYAFPHQTFLEYLAGLELVRGVAFVDRIMKWRHDDRWRVPIMLGIGHTVSEGVLSAPYQLLNRLLKARDRTQLERHRDLLFAAEIADDVGWERLERGGEEFEILRQELAQALVGVVEGITLPAADRVRAGVLLGRLGDIRPAVYEIPPTMVSFQNDSFLLGNTREEYTQIIALEKGTGHSDEARNWYESTINESVRTIQEFDIALFPITNAQYKRFIDGNGYNSSAPWWQNPSRSWREKLSFPTPEYWDDPKFGIRQSNLPVVGVSWFEAMAFCNWLTFSENDGFIYTLPNEIEWEYAARGRERRIYAWGWDPPDNEKTNFDSLHGCTSAVGCFADGATPEGLCEMTGNIFEWTRSAWISYMRETPQRDDIEYLSNGRVVLRGGAWNSPLFHLRASGRINRAPGRRYNYCGFRVVRHRKA